MGTVISVTAIIVSMISCGVALYTFFWTARRDRKQATLEAYNRLQAEVFDHLNPYKPSEITAICEDNKSSEYKTISGYIARIEHFCVGLNRGIYDKDTFYALAHGYFDGHQIQKRILPIIEAKNASVNSEEDFYNDTKSVLQWMTKKAANK